MSALTDLIAHRLQGAGVRALFGVPGGGGNLDLIESAGRAGIRFVLTSSETGGALAAIAMAEVSGRPGACLATLGPGAASLVNGVACAWLDRAPVLVFTDRHPLAAQGRHTHQQLDQRALFAPITKWSATLSAVNLDSGMRRLAENPPGPVHLDCPDDADAEDAPSAVTSPAADSAPSEVSFAALTAALASARRPLVLAGLGARSPADAIAIRRLCERRRLPALMTYKAKGVVPDDHAWFAGVFTNGAIERSVVESSDLIIGLGLDPVELLPRPWPYRQPVVYLGPWPVPSDHVPFATQAIAEVAGGIGHLEEALATSTWDALEIAQARDRQQQQIEIPGRALTAQRVVDITAGRLAASHRVTVDAGAHMFAATMRWPVAEPNRLLISNGLSTMGFALPAAIGAAVADPETPVVALTGDGGLLMCAGELLTAVRERLRIITVVFCDDALSLIAIKQTRKGYSPAGVSLGPVDWGALARGLGVTPFVARDETGLTAAIDLAAACSGPSLIAAHIDPGNHARTVQTVRG